MLTKEKAEDLRKIIKQPMAIVVIFYFIARHGGSTSMREIRENTEKSLFDKELKQQRFTEANKTIQNIGVKLTQSYGTHYSVKSQKIYLGINMIIEGAEKLITEKDNLIIEKINNKRIRENNYNKRERKLEV